jgi:hypothetical protein
LTANIPPESLPAAFREPIRSVTEHPTLTAKGPSETFNADPGMYRWLLEHPETGVKLWRQLGGKVAEISDHNGRYSWKDDKGSEVYWQIAYRSRGIHLWFAEGRIKPGILFPSSPFRAVVIMHYTEGKDTSGKPAIRHQVQFFVRCDSRALALAARLFGASAPRILEQYLGQLQMFYGGLAWYLAQDDNRARNLFRQVEAQPVGAQ